ncbi:MAG: recombinase family protein [Hungatella sp.]
MTQTFGYIRVSSKDQNEDRQLIALSEFDIAKCNLYLDKQSGKDFNRPAYQKMIRCLKKGDLLIIKAIDRLGRNYDEIIEQWRIITKEKGADIKVLDMPLLDTRQGRDLTGTFIADIVLQILSYVSQTERENIHQRQKEGIEAAHRKGIQFGRPSIGIPEEYYANYTKWKCGEIGSRTAAVALGVSQGTFLKWTKEFR